MQTIKINIHFHEFLVPVVIFKKKLILNNIRKVVLKALNILVFLTKNVLPLLAGFASLDLFLGVINRPGVSGAVLQSPPSFIF